MRAEPRRAVLVLDRFDPRRGGLEVYALALAQALARAGRAPIVLCATAAVDDASLEVVELGSEGVGFYSASDAWLAARADRRDLCVASFRHPGTSADVFLPLGGLLASSLDARRAAEPAWRAWIARLARGVSPRTRAFLERERAFFDTANATAAVDAARLRLVLANSPLVRAEIERRFPGFVGRVEVTGLPVDHERFAPPGAESRDRARQELGLRPDTPAILWIGNDARRKGLGLAKAVLRRLRLRKLDARLVLAGHGTERAHAPTNGLHGLGYVEDAERLFAATDVLLAPSLEDNLSLVALEALASGLPVVTSGRNGVAAWIQDRDVGRVVQDATSVEDFDAATLAMLRRGYLDEAPRAARRAAVADCAPELHFARVLELLG